MMPRASERAVTSHSVALSSIVGCQPRHDDARVSNAAGIIIDVKGMAIMLVRMKCMGNDLK